MLGHFQNERGLSQFKVMPFGLCNAPATFERLMESVLTDLTFGGCLAHLDDTTVIGHTLEEQLNNLRRVCQRFREAKQKLNPERFQLFRMFVSPYGVTTDSIKLEAVKSWPRSTDKHQLRSFLGLCSYYRMFTDSSAGIAKHLTGLTEEK